MKRKDGFTFIEVALVLAIAALIFLMAFLALPSLWMSQRDADRKARVMEFISDIKTYQTNNSRGALPSFTDNKNNSNGPEIFNFEDVRKSEFLKPEVTNTWPAFVRDYVSPDFEDASGNEYSFYVVKCLGEGGTELATGKGCVYGDKENIKFAEINDLGNVNNPYAIKKGNEEYIYMYVAIGATCDGDQAVKTNSTRSVAVIQVLERAGRHCYNT